MERNEKAGVRRGAGLRLVRRVYLVRCIGAAVAGIAVAPSIAGGRTHPAALMLLAAYCLVWPQIAYLFTRHARSPLRREKISLVIDAVVVGLLFPTMRFALFPSLLTGLFVIANGLAVAGPFAAGRNVIGLIIGVALGCVFSGIHIEIPSLDARILACLPLLVAYPLLLAYTAFVTGDKLANHARRLRHLTERDSLTGLWNRVSITMRVEELIGACGPDNMVGVFFIDLDRFKDVNDSLGHGAGDRLLAVVAQRLQTCVPEDAAVARYGGDEFVIALPARSKAQIELYASRLLASLTSAVGTSDTELYVTASIGISIFPADGQTAQTLIDHADTAMYRVKRAGPNDFQFYEPDMGQQACAAQSIANRLRKTRTTHLRLEYQPQIDMRSGALIGAEALLRWHDPELGEVPPGIFIPIAEQTELIGDIGNWVLRAVCEQSRSWSADWGASISLSVNVSPFQLRRPGLSAFMRHLLQDTEVDPALLELEVTESALLDPDGVAVAEIHALRALGLRVAVDDFGTGYSCLSHLNSLEIDRIKIDRSFVSHVGHSADADPVIDAIIAMAASLKIDLIAEGVETEVQRDFLVLRGCTAAQGFLYSASISAGELLRTYARIAACFPQEARLRNHSLNHQ